MLDTKKVTQYALSKKLGEKKQLRSWVSQFLYYFLSIMSQRKYIDYA